MFLNLHEILCGDFSKGALSNKRSRCGLACIKEHTQPNNSIKQAVRVQKHDDCAS